MDLKLFKECIQVLEEKQEYDNELSKLLIDHYSNGWIKTFTPIEDVLIKVLKTSLNDKYDYIDEWLYGITTDKRVWEEIDDEVDIEYDLTEIESLYWYLRGEYDKVPQRKVPHTPVNTNVVDLDAVKEMWDIDTIKKTWEMNEQET